MVNSPVFIDTSAFYAIIDRSDLFHEPAGHAWTFLLQTDKPLITSNYIILETTALLQSRIGQEAALVFNNDILTVVDVH